MAKAKGFSSFHSYETYTGLARKEGYDKARTELRKTELAKAKKEEYLDTMDTRPKYVKKLQGGIKTFHKGVEQYNSVMDELKGLGSDKQFNNGRNSDQAYSSGYGIYNPRPRKEKQESFASMYGMEQPKQKRRKTKKKQKHKKRSKTKTPYNPWAQF